MNLAIFFLSVADGDNADGRLDMRLYKFCHRDATRQCHAPQHWYSQRQPAEGSAPALGYLVLACLYRSITHVAVDDTGANLQQDMHQVIFSTCDFRLRLM